ncbi:uncharacterized protein A4U43_C05F10580 [Asparagus officinalis]|uniref:HMA domain-containing protein n=1 Tax=Asparagus officinalis TaxID=4686 RepID=A0A5P1EQS6_ASPOF|nr:heavy metal-associated isoprenylated plant protein 47-like [Asparagus officinalis]XP_020268255.1 heavy metal-associated isoprenylated plant protein 47-like [Asparagus officinalis]ONK68358.1 uncharacterized protein A4U43_C05F10580 [Asparagus officinalis]
MAKQKIVIRVTMKDAKKRSKALKIAVGLPGVISAGLGGVDKDTIVVVGDGIDSVELTMILRKRMGSADLVSVTTTNEKKYKEFEGDQRTTMQIWPSQTPFASYDSYSPYSSYPYTYQVHEPTPSCATM